MNVYISGPMRRIKEFNFPAFIAAEATVRELYPDAEIFSPARKDIDAGFAWEGRTGNESLKYELGFDLRESLAVDMEYIALRADAVYMLKGWSQSSGARAELALAEALGLEVLYERGALGENTPDWEDGREDGYAAGYEDGRSDGYTDGADDCLYGEWDVDAARDEGYQEGYDAAMEDAGL